MRRALLIGAIAVAGCGGGSDDGGLSASDYRKQANALCRATERAADRIPEARSADQLDDLFEGIIDTAEPYDRRYDALDPPDELRAKHEEAVREGDRQERYVRRLVLRLRRSQDQVALLRDEFPRLARLVDQGNRTARSLGLEDCVEELGPPGAAPDSSTS